MNIQWILVVLGISLLPTTLYCDSGFYFDDPEGVNNQGSSPYYKPDPTFTGYKAAKDSKKTEEKPQKEDEINSEYSFSALSQKVKKKEPSVNPQEKPAPTVSEIESKLQKSKKGGLTFSALSSQLKKQPATKNAESGTETSPNAASQTGSPNDPTLNPSQTNSTNTPNSSGKPNQKPTDDTD